jgi:hypothetical protein
LELIEKEVEERRELIEAAASDRNTLKRRIENLRTYIDTKYELLHAYRRNVFAQAWETKADDPGRTPGTRREIFLDGKSRVVPLPHSTLQNQLIQNAFQELIKEMKEHSEDESGCVTVFFDPPRCFEGRPKLTIWVQGTKPITEDRRCNVTGIIGGQEPGSGLGQVVVDLEKAGAQLSLVDGSKRWNCTFRIDVSVWWWLSSASGHLVAEIVHLLTGYDSLSGKEKILQAANKAVCQTDITTEWLDELDRLGEECGSELPQFAEQLKRVTTALRGVCANVLESQNSKAIDEAFRSDLKSWWEDPCSWLVRSSHEARSSVRSGNCSDLRPRDWYTWRLARDAIQWAQAFGQIGMVCVGNGPSEGQRVQIGLDKKGLKYLTNNSQDVSNPLQALGTRLNAIGLEPELIDDGNTVTAYFPVRRVT